MTTNAFAYSVSYSEELTEDEFVKAEDCLQILNEAVDAFESALRENGFALSEGNVIQGSVFQDWFANYQENTTDECYQCKSTKKLNELCPVKINISDRDIKLVCAECRAKHKYFKI